MNYSYRLCNLKLCKDRKRSLGELVEIWYKETGVKGYRSKVDSGIKFIFNHNFTFFEELSVNQRVCSKKCVREMINNQ